MDTYIVRIYRRKTEDARELVGTVETLGGERASFGSREELWSALAGIRAAPGNRKKRRLPAPQKS